MGDVTDRLRATLAERGVEYETEDRPTLFAWTYWGDWAFYEPLDARPRTLGARCELTLIPATPEQAVEATLGRPKVKKVRNMTYDHTGGEVYFLACSGCGEWIDGDLGCIGEFDGPKFCSNCGGEFDGPKLCSKCGRLADLEYGDLCAECYEGDAE